MASSKADHQGNGCCPQKDGCANVHLLFGLGEDSGQCARRDWCQACGLVKDAVGAATSLKGMNVCTGAALVAKGMRSFPWCQLGSKDLLFRESPSPGTNP